MPKNYGLNLPKELQEQSEKDWLFGAASLKCLAEIPEKERQLYLPKGEIQRSRIEDMMDCASRGPINVLETQFNWLIRNKKFTLANELWLREKKYVNEINEVEFSDAFVAINSGTTKQYGNSLKAPLEAIREQGLIPKKLLPLEDWMTWEDYHNHQRITDIMIQLGKEFAERFTINYERVNEDTFEMLLQKDLIDVAGYAWPDAKNEEYGFSNLPPNHAFILYKRPAFYAFDNYIDYGDDFIKKLTPDYNFHHYGYRVFISAEKKQTLNGKENIIDAHYFFPWWKRWWKEITK